MVYQNPIIPGFAPDPSIVRIEDTFYLVNSSFHLYPGLPIFASKDLIAWRHIGNAIHRPPQLRLSQSGTKLNSGGDDSGEKAPATGGLYAPTIRHHNGITYIVCTNVIYNPKKDEGDWVSGLKFQNFIISTADIQGGQWSDPVYFDLHGIDPDLFFDDDGRRITQETVLWHGFTRIIPEGPHIYKRDGYYFLLTAKGGTHDGHCISIARAPSIWGPYESCSRNPILPPTAEQNLPSFCQFNGHGDLVQDFHGDWWLVCLGVRRDRAGRMVLGRETFLAAVVWQNGQSWPRIQQPIPRVLRRIPVGGKAGLEDDSCFLPSWPVGPVPSPLSPKTDLVWIRDPDFSHCQISQNTKVISLLPLPTDLGQCTGGSTAFVGRRIRRVEGVATVDLLVSPVLEHIKGAKIGLAYYKDEYRYARIQYDPSDHVIVFDMVNHSKDPPILIGSRLKANSAQVTRIQFRIFYTQHLIHFLYRLGEGDNWNRWQSHGLVDALDMTGNDFTGPVIGIFAIAKGGEWCNFDNIDI
ncbi:unnamed protein product [Penicillium palitans]